MSEKGNATPSGGANRGENRGFVRFDPQKILNRGGVSSGGNFADEPEPANTSQLRDVIDCGKTGEKVNASDPAAAPLGTDAEASGSPSVALKTPEDADDARGSNREDVRRRPRLPTDR